MTESRPWDDALARSRATAWDVRERAVHELGRYVEQPEVRDRLQELLDDEDTAVIIPAAEQLVLHGGPNGFAIAVEAWAYGDQDSRQDIVETLYFLRNDSVPIDDAVRNLLTTTPDERMREAARQLAKYLGVT